MSEKPGFSALNVSVAFMKAVFLLVTHDTHHRLAFFVPRLPCKLDKINFNIEYTCIHQWRLSLYFLYCETVTLWRGGRGLKLNATMKLWFPQAVWTSPVKAVYNTYTCIPYTLCIVTSIASVFSGFSIFSLFSLPDQSLAMYHQFMRFVQVPERVNFKHYDRQFISDISANFTRFLSPISCLTPLTWHYIKYVKTCSKSCTWTTYHNSWNFRFKNYLCTIFLC